MSASNRKTLIHDFSTDTSVELASTVANPAQQRAQVVDEAIVRGTTVLPELTEAGALERIDRALGMG